MKKILFSDDFIEKIKENDPKISIELVKNVVESSLNLRAMLQENYKKAIVFDDKDFDIEKDYLILVHKYENEIRDLKNVKKNEKIQ